MTGTPVNDVTTDDTLFKIEAAGTLVVTTATSAATGPASDIDLALYKSNEAGDATGDALVKSESETSDEKVSAKVTPGYYLARAYAFVAANDGFKGTAALTPSGAAPAPTAGPGATPTPGPGGGGDTPPTATIGKLAKAARTKKVKSFSGSASDDKGVARVEVALVLKKGKKCSQLTATGRFKKLAKCASPTAFLVAKGTTKWTFKLRQTLKKGSYTLFAAAVDSGGQRQAGFSAASRKSFKVK